MQTVKRELECAKEAVELGEGVSKFVLALKKALEDGWQLDQDLPVIIQSAMADLIPSIEGMEEIGAETANTQAFVNAVYVGLHPIPFAFIAKKEG